MGRFRNVTKFLFHPTPERPTAPNVGFLRYEPGAGFPIAQARLRADLVRHRGRVPDGREEVWPGHLVYMEDPHFESEMRTETGGTVLFVQYPGPTTGGRPIYEGRMNLKAAPAPETLISSTDRIHVPWLSWRIALGEVLAVIAPTERAWAAPMFVSS